MGHRAIGDVMTFSWPAMLWLLLVLPVLAAAYVAFVRRRKKAARAYAGLRTPATAAGAGPAIKRALPPAIFLLAVAALLMAAARPMAVVNAPSLHRTVILAIDTSGSMRARDVSPDRFSSAQSAARAFVANLPRQTRVGIVAFAGTASVVQPPTQSREDAVAAIERLQVQGGTAVGSAIVASLNAIFPDARIDLEASARRSAGTGKGDSRNAPGAPSLSSRDALKPAEPGSYSSATVILFTDGQTTSGPDPVEAARVAADRGVRVYCVGIGTQKGETITVEGWSVRVRVDEEALKNIAVLTHGEYFFGGTPEDLAQTYRQLDARLFWERKETEITSLFAAAGGLLALIAAALSLWWFNRIL